MAIESHKDLEVWQMGMALAEHCYRLTSSFHRDEIYGMTGQIRRASVSIPANIAEGYGRDQTGAYIQFLRISQGSARELETHLLLAERVGLASRESVVQPLANCERISKMLRSLIRTLEARRDSKA